MAGQKARLSPYSGTVVASLRLAAALVIACDLGGCAMPGSFGSMFSKSDKGEARSYTSDEVTGSVGVTPAAAPTATLAATPIAVSTSALPSETDLVFTRMAIVDVLQRGSKEISAPWENPSSGARGTVTPIASAYARDGLTCRDVLASYVGRGRAEAWMQGEACRTKGGRWEVKSLRPWSRS